MMMVFAVLIQCTIGFAQKTTQPLTQEQVRVQLAQGMVNLIDAVKPAYTKGTTQDQFIIKLCGKWKPTPEGKAVLVRAFSYISLGYTVDGVLRNYNGKEMAAAALLYKNIYTKNPKTDGSEIFGGVTGAVNQFATENPRPKCKWYQLGCILDWVGGYITDNCPWLCPIIIKILGL